MAEITPAFQGEIQLRRWSESSTQGVQVTFALADTDDLGKFRGLEGKRFMAVLVQLGDDEQPVAPAIGNPISPQPRERLGDLAWRAVQWCKDPEFWCFLSQNYCAEDGGVYDENGAKSLVQIKCGVTSRKELDTSHEAARKFNQLIRGPYHKHLMARGLA